MKTKIFFGLLLLTFTTKVICSDYFVHETSGVIIRFTCNENMFPESWRGGKVNGQAVSLDTIELQRSLEIIYRALDKYPVEVLKANLKEIYILDEIKFYNQFYGGTNSNDVVYLTNKGVAMGYTDTYLEQLFHAEFSSILLRNYAPIDYDERWCSINDSNFRYGKGGVNEIKKGKAGLEFDVVYHEAGFLYEYAMSGSENDLNSIVKSLFCPSEDFWDIYYNYDKIKQKIDLTIELYMTINENFNLEYFKKFAEK